TSSASGTLSISDVDTSDNPVSYPDVGATAGDNGFGTFEITGNTWTYNLNNGHAAVQALDAGESLTDTYTFTASDGSTQLVTVTINGAEDAPVLGGTTTGTVAEDGALTANGTLSISDVDSSDNPISFPDEASTLGDNGYGSFALTGGTWTYTLNNGHATVQALDAGESLSDTHTFTASDGSTQAVTVTINGAEDAPVITGTTTGTVAEDGALTANGTLSVSDTDTSDNPISFADEASTVGDNGYGSFALTGGTWTYTLNNGHAAVQALDAGESLSDTHTFTASDGSTQVVTATINGAEDAPVITATASGSVTVDGAQTTSGSLSISDADASDNPIGFADVAVTAGDNGYGSFELSGGTWTYTLDGTHAAVQALGGDQSLTDSHTFIASDGSTQLVTVTINGVDQVVGDPVTPPWPDPPNDDDEEGEPPVPPDVDDDPPDDQPDPVPPVDEDPDGDGTGEPPREDDNDGVITFPSATPMPAHQPLPSDEVLLSVLGDRDNNQSQAASTKPSVEQARTFVQELKAIWTEQPELAPPALQNVTQSEAFWIDVDEMLNDFDEDAEKQQRLEKIGAEAAAGVGVSLTAGFVSWALRAGSMAASFLAAMPTWRSFDPMPVLAADDEKKRRTVGDAADDDDDAEEQDDAKVDRMFDR
nr:VCBS domain-containing protein [Gammaproteobacteria bacterium]